MNFKKSAIFVFFLLLFVLMIHLSFSAKLSDVVCCIVSPTQSICYNTSTSFASSCFGPMDNYNNYKDCNQKLFNEFYCLDIARCGSVLNDGSSNDPLMYKACLSYYSACNALYGADVPEPDFPDSLNHNIFPGVGIYSFYYVSKLRNIDEALSKIDLNKLKEDILSKLNDCKNKGYTEGLRDVNTKAFCEPSCFSKQDCCKVELSGIFTDQTLYFCGTVDDGCGNEYDCGDCPDGYHCEIGTYGVGVCFPNDGTSPIDMCLPLCNESTCCDGVECGYVNDGCGHVYNCGSCSSGYHCEGNVCEKDCIPRCLDKEDCCGDSDALIVDDGCGHVYNCSKLDLNTVQGDDNYNLTIFVTPLKHNGDFIHDSDLENVGNRDCSGLSGDNKARCMMDNFCYINKPPFLKCEDLHAFISVNENDEIRDMPRNYGYSTDEPLYWYNPSSNSFVKMSDNWNDMLDGSIDVSQCAATDQCTEEEVCVISTKASLWTGSHSDGSLSNNCKHWSSDDGHIGFLCSPSGDLGAVGHSEKTNKMWLDVASDWFWSDLPCDQESHLRCIGKCKIENEDKREIRNYNDGTLFVISSADWKSVLSLVPVTIWQEMDPDVLRKCQHIYHDGLPDLDNICGYPVIVYSEGNHTKCTFNYFNSSDSRWYLETTTCRGVDIQSLISFVKEYYQNDDHHKEIIFVNLSESLNDPSYDYNFNNVIDKTTYYAHNVDYKISVDQIYPQDYYKFWRKISLVIYNEDNYSSALLGSVFASLINAPFVVEGSSLDNSFLDDKQLICIGEVNKRKDQCLLNYNINDLRYIYKVLTNTNRLLITNSEDRRMFVRGSYSYTLPKDYGVKAYSDDAKNICNSLKKDTGATDCISILEDSYLTFYDNLSMVAPFLAAAKKELLYDLPHYHTIDDLSDGENNLFCSPICNYFDSKIFKIVNDEFENVGDNFEYLTIFASPIAIPKSQKSYSAIDLIVDAWSFFHVSVKYTLDVTRYADVDKPLGLDYDDAFFDSSPDLKVGRIGGFTTTDVSAFVSRILFFNKLPKSEKVIFTATGGSHMVKRAARWIKYFKEVGYNIFCAISDFDFRRFIFLDYCYDLNKINREHLCKVFNLSDYELEYDDESAGDILRDNMSSSTIWNFHRRNLLYFHQGHSSVDGPTILESGHFYSSYDPYVSAYLVDIGACLSCESWNNSYSFCDNMFRKGAVGFVGATSVTMYAPNLIITPDLVKSFSSLLEQIIEQISGVESPNNVEFSISLSDLVGATINIIGANSDIYHQFLNGIFAKKIPIYNYWIGKEESTINVPPNGFDLGTAFIKAYSENQYEYMSILLGDPTFRLPIPHRLKHYLDAKFSTFSLCPDYE